MNVNFGLFPPLAEVIKGRARKQALARRALADIEALCAPSQPQA